MRITWVERFAALLTMFAVLWPRSSDSVTAAEPSSGLIAVPTEKAHAGGVRFEPNSREYQTLLDWIDGARLPAGPKSASR